MDNVVILVSVNIVIIASNLTVKKGIIKEGFVIQTGKVKNLVFLSIVLKNLTLD